MSNDQNNGGTNNNGETLTVAEVEEWTQKQEEARDARYDELRI